MGWNGAHTSGDWWDGDAGRLGGSVGRGGRLGRRNGNSDDRLAAGLGNGVGLGLAVVAVRADSDSHSCLSRAVVVGSDGCRLRSLSGVDNDISGVDSRVVGGSKVGAVDDGRSAAADGGGAWHEGVGSRGDRRVDGCRVASRLRGRHNGGSRRSGVLVATRLARSNGDGAGSHRGNHSSSGSLGDRADRRRGVGGDDLSRRRTS